MILIIITALVWAALGRPVEAPAQDGDLLLQIQPKKYTAYRSIGSVNIDGRLDEPSWQRAVWTDPFVDIEGEEMKPKPRFSTRAKMLWDDTYFYVAAEMEEPHVWATLRDRDATIYHDNDFEVFMDPDGDTHEYYEFEINAFGTEWDLFLMKPYRDGGPYMTAWDVGGLKTSVAVWGSINDPTDEDEGWSLEMAFPWSVLKECAHRPSPPRDGDQWRVNFSRVEWRVEAEPDNEGYAKVEGERPDNWVWSPQGLIQMHLPEQWGFVRFSTAAVGTAGTGAFELPPEEEAKHLLREIYYRQREFRQETGHYTGSLDSLGVEHRLMRNFLWPPSLQATDYLFEAWVEEVVDLHDDGKINRWVIRQDSKTWKAVPATP